MGVYPVVSKSDLEHMLIAEKPVIVEVRDSDEAGDLFESISNENEKNAIFFSINRMKFHYISDLMGAASSLPAYFYFQRGEKIDGCYQPTETQLREFLGKSLSN